MNTKRQTVWLVSMLSLMVILSAYYLFTEDNGSANLTTDSAHPDNAIVQNAEEAASGSGAADGDDQVTVDEVQSPSPANGQTADSGTDVTAGDTADKADTADKVDTADKADTADTTDAISEKDQEVLNQLKTQGTATSGSSLISKLQFDRQEEISKETDRLYGIVTDTGQNSEEASKALAQIDQLETRESKISGLEDQLQKTYHSAVVSEEPADSYKIVVQSDKLEKNQAADIVDMVMNTLSVPADKVSIQYVP